ncbi:MAG: hypothetical protein AAGD14_12640 [Planctomycetota bacterium]
MPRIILQPEHLASIQQVLKEKRGVDFNTSNAEAVRSMLSYWCRESAKGEAEVETVTQKDTGYLIDGNADFFTALQTVL